jgi:Tfp pilus assembly protein PilW
MPSMRSTPPSNAERGFSLIELLVATTVMMTVLAGVGGLFAAARKTMQNQILRIETLQGLRSAMDIMARDLRLGGACLPIIGAPITLWGVSGTTDQILTRTGLVRPNETCVRSALATGASVSPTATTIPLQSAAGFVPGMLAYIVTNAGVADAFTITAVNTTNNTLSKTGTFTCGGGGCPTPAYASPNSVYAVDQRLYAIDTSNAALPVLTVAVNGGTPMPFASGIENLQVQYQLERNCDQDAGCDVVDLPVGSDWTLVRQLYITLTARSRTVDSNGQYSRVTQTFNAKPRNLLPGG